MDYKFKKPSFTWKLLLDEVWERYPDTWGWGTLLNHALHPICTEDGVKPHELDKAVMFLTDMGLIERDTVTWRLTARGFNVALQNEKIKNDEMNRGRMLYATCVIAGAAVLQLIFSVFN